MLTSWGNQNKVEVVGVPRFDRYSQGGQFQKRRCNEQSEAGKSVLNVLVVTAKTPAFTNDQMETVKRSLLDLKAYGDDPANAVNILWRLTAGLDDYLNVENSASDLSGNELFQQLQAADAVIATPSTSVIEAMLADLPTAVLNYHVCPTYLSPAWQINGSEQIADVAGELREPSEAKMTFQRYTLAQTLSHQSDATEVMATLIRKMANLAQEQITAGQRLCFTQPVLDRVAPTHSPLNHVRLFPEDKTFQNSDIVELQALLSNARRHIEHQAQRISALEAELTQAHNIFDQINTHPLAGPVIRLRERILKVLSAGSRNEVLLDDPETETKTAHESGSPTV
jgi:hypothetical protein